jgi:nucleoside-diphosphate-sugar epimerase
VNILVTGGAGFIGSNLVRCLAASGKRVRVLDNLSTGSAENLRDVNGAVDLVLGDIRSPLDTTRAMAGVEIVYHLAALPSVARSVSDPSATNEVNVGGTLNVLKACLDAGVRRVICASSSSVYGDTPTLPKHEDMVPMPLSPYAASKLACEAYCRSFKRSYGLETVSLRFFNVFGPRQDPRSEYAAVIPRFITRMLAGKGPVVYGDGAQSRDFTYVANAVQACVLAADAGPEAVGEAINVGCGDRYSLRTLTTSLNDLLGTDLRPESGPPREGDVRHSEASITKAHSLLGYRPLVSLRDGLSQTISWFRSAAEMAGSR